MDSILYRNSGSLTILLIENMMVSALFSDNYNYSVLDIFTHSLGYIIMSLQLGL